MIARKDRGNLLPLSVGLLQAGSRVYRICGGKERGSRGFSVKEFPVLLTGLI